MQNSILENGVNVHISPSSIDTTLDKIQFEYDVLVAGQNHLSKNWRIHVSLNHKNTLSAAENNTICCFWVMINIGRLKEAWSKLGDV
jgi:maltose phosphorylase